VRLVEFALHTMHINVMVFLGYLFQWFFDSGGFLPSCMLLVVQYLMSLATVDLHKCNVAYSWECVETSFILFNFSGVYLILWEHAELGAEECVLGAEALDRSGMCC